MTGDRPESDRFLILADESAGWEIAGLRQVERLILALNEFAGSTSPKVRIGIHVLWKPEVPPTPGWLPEPSRVPCVELTKARRSFQSGARILGTHLFVGRNKLANFLQTTPAVHFDLPTVDSLTTWQHLSEQFERVCQSAIRLDQKNDWRFLARSDEIRGCEREFLRRAGKSQDGIVSKFLNRPISRSVTRLLLKSPLHPIVWTALIFALPLIACIFLLDGHYVDVVIGAAIFQLYSILDGCDGEIARAKYLESERGARVDDFCDTLGSVLFVIALGLGLSGSHASDGHSWFYGVEGILCAAIMVANELVLRFSKTEAVPDSATLTQALYPRHRGMIQHSGVLFLGERFVWWLVQFTKRDVAIVGFLVLALANFPQWILHLWTAVAGVTLGLSGIARLTGANRHNVVPLGPQS